MQMQTLKTLEALRFLENQLLPLHSLDRLYIIKNGQPLIILIVFDVMNLVLKLKTILIGTWAGSWRDHDQENRTINGVWFVRRASDSRTMQHGCREVG